MINKREKRQDPYTERKKRQPKEKVIKKLDDRYRRK